MTGLVGGRTTYGHVLGVLMLDTRFPRPVGDIGNAGTWPFPVLYRVVEGATQSEVVGDREGRYLQPFVDAARELEAAGVRIISTSCGYLAQFQRELAARVTIPVVTSSLLQVPLVASLVGPERPIGILTVSDELGERHFRAAGFGADTIPLAIGILPRDSEFVSVHGAFDGVRTEAATDVMAAEVLASARRLVAETPDLAAIVMECTNLVPYSAMVRRELGLPVFDIYTAVSFAASALRLSEPTWAAAGAWFA